MNNISGVITQHHSKSHPHNEIVHISSTTYIFVAYQKFLESLIWTITY
jgi:hypothetical protein